MKKIAFLFGVVVSAFVLTSCCGSKCASMNQPAASDNSMSAKMPAHHRHHRDYKGEVSK